MPSRVPIVRQIQYSRMISVVAVLLIVMGASTFLARGPIGTTVGGAVVIAYVLTARALIARNHQRGMQLVRRHQFPDAIPAFQKSYEFFDRHLWIDHWRSLVLLSPSAVSYREMALLNIAFCHSQTGNGSKAVEVYQRTLQEFPGSGIATAALNMLESAKN
jgi:hypothetical protein